MFFFRAKNMFARDGEAKFNKMYMEAWCIHGRELSYLVFFPHQDIDNSSASVAFRKF